MTTQPLGPLRHAPLRIRPPFDAAGGSPDCPEAKHNDRITAVLEALDGIELGAYDRRIIARLAERDIQTVGTVVSLFYRARAAGGVS